MLLIEPSKTVLQEFQHQNMRSFVCSTITLLLAVIRLLGGRELRRTMLAKGCGGLQRVAKGCMERALEGLQRVQRAAAAGYS